MKSKLLMLFGILTIFSISVLFSTDLTYGWGAVPSLGGFITTDEHSEFIDFQSFYPPGVSIQFILEKTSHSDCNSFHAEITDKKGNIVWSEGAFAMCGPQNEFLKTSQIKIGYNDDQPLIINDSGIYYLEVEFDGKITKREFKVRTNTTGVSLDRTVYSTPFHISPLKQFQHGLSIDEIECREFLILMSKHDGSPACVTPSTAPKLADRGWSWVLDLELWEEGFVLIPATTYEIKTDQGSYGSQYQISGASIKNISYDKTANSMIILMKSSERGTLQIVVPSGLLHSVTQLPFSYFVLANNEEIDFEELSPIILKIAFDSGTERLEIIGAFP